LVSLLGDECECEVERLVHCVAVDQVAPKAAQGRADALPSAAGVVVEERAKCFGGVAQLLAGALLGAAVRGEGSESEALAGGGR
jgi:hypothetical protein